MNKERTTIIGAYADGGVIGRNPSLIGGTWAWCHVNAANERIDLDSGVITPRDADMPAITNNLTEMYALVRCLSALPVGWAGVVYSDSQVTLGRLFEGWRLKNVPLWLIKQGEAAINRIDRPRCTYVLLDGHPTRAQLLSGRGKRDNPVSEHNVFCDTACREAAANQ